MATIIHTVKLAADVQKAIADITKYEDKISAVAQTVSKHERTLSGDNILKAAHNWTAAVGRLGGATGDLIKQEELLAGAAKLTAVEKARVNRAIEEALEKYRALGQNAPTAMLQLADATKQVDAATAHAGHSTHKLMEEYVKIFSGEATKGMHGLGVGILDDATAITGAIGKIGGASKLTDAEMVKVNKTVGEAIAKYQAMGQTAPPEMQALYDATAKMPPANESWTTSIKNVALGYLAGVATWEAAKRAVRAVIDFATDAVRAYAEEEAAIIKVTQALKTQGVTSPAVVQQYRDLASGLQRVTTYSDDAALSAQALLIQIGHAMPSQMERGLRATADLATGLGVDLNSAALLVAKAMTGNTQSLNRYGIAIDEARFQTEGAVAVFDAIERRFGGQAQAELDTFGGKVKQLANLWGDLKEKLGEFVATSPMVELAIRNINKELNDQSQATTTLGSSQLGGIGLVLVLLNEWAKNAVDTEKALERLRQNGIEPLVGHLQRMAPSVSHNSDLLAQQAQRVKAVEERLVQLRNVGLVPLSQQQQRWIRELLDLKQSHEEIAELLGISQIAVQRFDDRLKASTKTASDAQKEFKKAAEKIREIEDASLHVPPAVEQMGTKIDFARDKSIEFMNAMDETSISLRGAEKAISDGLWSWESLKKLQNENARATESFGTVLGSVLGAVANIFNNIEGKGTQMAVVVVRAFQEIVKAAEAMKNATSDAQRTMAGATGLASTLIAFYQIAVMASGGASKMRAELDKSRRTFIDTAGGADELIKRLHALGQPDLVSRILYAPNLEAFNRAVDDFNKVVERWEKRVQGLESAAGGLKKLVDAFKEMGKVGVEQFDRIGLYAAVVFAQILRETGSLSRAFEAVKPAIETLLDAIGDGGSAATRQIIDLYKTIEKNKPAVQAIEALTQIMAGLEAAGVRSQELFNAFGLDLVAIFKKLTGDGVDAKMALVLMQPALQKLWELQQKFGFAVDEGTQALIDQGVEFGLIGPNMRDVNEQILEVLKAIKDILASVTAGWQQAAAAVDRYGDAVGNIPTGPQPGDPGWQFHTGGPVYHTGGKVLAFQRKVLRAHTGLAVDEVPAILQTGEFVLSRRDVSRIGMASIQAMRAGARPNRAAMGATTVQGGPTYQFNVSLPGNVFLQTPQDKARLAREVGDAIMQEMRMRGRIGAVA